MKYQVIEEFKGAPDGKRTLTFTTDQEIAHTDLGDDLAEVALREGWIEEIKQRKPRSSNKKKKAAQAEGGSEDELDLGNEIHE